MEPQELFSVVSYIKTQQKVASTTFKPQSQMPSTTHADNGCEKNVDTCFSRKNFVILNYTTKTADVYV